MDAELANENSLPQELDENTKSKEEMLRTKVRSRPVKSKLKEEVHEAVKDYLDKLIKERSAPIGGHTMAVSSHQLKNDAKEAISKINYKLTITATPISVRQLQVSPSPQQTSVIDHVIDKLELSEEGKKKEFITIPTGDPEERSRSPTIRPKSQSQVRRPKSVPPSLVRERLTSGRKHRKDYHWSVWKTTPTPPPPSEFKESPRPKSRIEDAIRPKTRTSERKEETTRSLSRATETSKDDERNEAFQSPIPEPFRATVRPTSRALYKNQNISALKNLIDNSNDYERQVAVNLLKALENSGRRAQSAKPSKSYSYGIRTTLAEPNFPGTCTDESSRYFRMLSDNLQGNGYGFPRHEGERPLHVHQRRGPLRKDFIHERSFFTNARSPYKSSFVIHPEFVSESKEYWSLRKNNNRF